MIPTDETSAWVGLSPGTSGAQRSSALTAAPRAATRAVSSAQDRSSPPLWVLDDLALKRSHPRAYRRICAAIGLARRDRDATVAGMAEELWGLLQLAGISAVIAGRAKSVYSVYAKMQRQSIGIDEVWDLWGLRVIVGSRAACYGVLAVVHAAWAPINSLFSDYIAAPKPNGYQALHTKVLSPAGILLEIQIRSIAMQRNAAVGRAAHSRYKPEHADGALAPESRRALRLLACADPDSLGRNGWARANPPEGWSEAPKQRG